MRLDVLLVYNVLVNGRRSFPGNRLIFKSRYRRDPFERTTPIESNPDLATAIKLDGCPEAVYLRTIRVMCRSRRVAIKLIGLLA